MDAWSKKVATGIQNLAQHESFTVEQVGNFKNQATNVERNITIRTVVNGEVQNVRVKAIGFDEAGNVRIQEYTTAKDGLNISRQKALEAISKNGGVIVGDGKGKFTGGVEIPKGTQIDVVSQKTNNIQVGKNGLSFEVIQTSDGDIAYLSKSIGADGKPSPVRSLDYLNDEGKIKWPEPGTYGFVVDDAGNPIMGNADIKSGMILDRYGDSGGTYVSPVEDGVSFPYESRGLPYPETYYKKHTYEVVKDINKTNYEEAFINLSKADQIDLLEKMETFNFTHEDIYSPQIGKIAEVFDSGGGLQIKLGTSVSIYEQLGFLKEVN